MRHELLKGVRYNWEKEWQDIRYLVRPTGQDASRTPYSGEQDRSIQIYDGTAPAALEEAAASLHSAVVNPVDKWFGLTTDDPELNDEPEVLEWLEEVSDAIYAVYSNQDTNFDQTMHETCLDLLSFGTAIPSQEWSERIKNPIFKCHPTASCWLEEDAEGRINRLHRVRKYTITQLADWFGVEALSPDMRKELMEKPLAEHELLHMVYERTDRDRDRIDSGNMLYASCWIECKEKWILKEKGYKSFPYHPTRWAKMSHEPYGRSPAHECLPDIRMLNALDRLILKAASKAVDPPLVVSDVGVILPINTHPGALIIKESGTESPEPLASNAQFEVSLEITNQKREHIRRCFFADWFRMEKQNIEMTATEVMDRREEKLRLIAPMLGRQQSELLGPMIMRTYELLVDHGRIRPFPLEGSTKLKIEYLSSAAKAQTGVKAIAMNRYIQELVPIAQVDPTVFDSIDFSKFAKELAIQRGVTRRIFRSPEEIQEIQQQRKDASAHQQMADVAKPASEAIKNIAAARAQGTDVANILQMAQ